MLRGLGVEVHPRAGAVLTGGRLDRMGSLRDTALRHRAGAVTTRPRPTRGHPTVATQAEVPGRPVVDTLLLHHVPQHLSITDQAAVVVDRAALEAAGTQ